MKKKTETENPEQETEEQGQETETEETSEEGQAQEETTEEKSEEQKTEESGTEQESGTEEGQESAEQELPAGSQNSEEADLKSALLEAQGKLAAYAAGVAPGMIDDAVTLAMAEAAKAGDVTEAAVTKAMDAVLKRHPEWKAAGSDKKKTGGFKLGADRDGLSTGKKNTGNATQNVKRWNRFK